MSIKLQPLFETIRASFWFIPTAMVFSTMLMTIFTIWIDASSLFSIKQHLPLVYSTNVSAIRSLLSTIAASMITVTSIAFSITIVALTLASSQFGPRLMRNFMKDRTTQLVLGVFISNFLYCIFVFCAISLEPPYNFRPGVTVIWAILMTCVSIGFLIHFIHHVAISIQADKVIQDVYCELKSSITRLFPNQPAKGMIQERISKQQCGENEFTNHQEFRSPKSGYVQLIDLPPLVKTLASLDWQMKLHFAPGDYVIKGSVFGVIYSKQPTNKEDFSFINQHCILGGERTPVQDPEFAVAQLVEIALRALSPGINDPFTAMTCIDKLSSALCNLATREFPNSQYYDVNNCLRVQRSLLSFSDIAKAAFDQIRQHSENNTAVTLSLLVSLKNIALRAHNKEQYAFIYEQTNMISEQQLSRNVASNDADIIKAKIKTIFDYIGGN